MTKFRALQRHGLQPDTRVCLFDNGLPLSLKPEDSALNSMTDLRRVPAASTKPESTIDQAMQRMIHVGVRLLFVLDDLGTLVGLITARDIMGEKPVRLAAEDHIARDDIKVQNIMVPLGQIDVLDFPEVERSTVGDIVLTLRKAGRQHALVREETTHGFEIRGIFSISQIARQLGVTLQSNDVVQSFAGLEQLIASDD
ncbi:CBS domain-containing protein [Acidithiobacillus thiooxidans]|uniref:CBS domain-containing protein n=1 Tax=Acidithiobacillus TaxID=119977 RepID=UPI0004E16069|nr:MULTISPECIES: CBS domain-containing protein [Acidithiobacillus]MBU2752684.1 CBS domain-containing protein [Acidithiobacillus thiooxidans]MBU2835772.1 CBS domain-containing protein [Acidithiobacillus thiooxidans]MDA8176599.1 CBS domain-containing protein [Acidithiobacillus sp.]MDR7925409.1 CBS domain-containing protein [Acidithiobacillus thiooxidans]